MEEILNKLEKVQDLKVKSRTAVEKYRDSKTDFSDITKELSVNYILKLRNKNDNKSNYLFQYKKDVYFLSHKSFHY